MGIKFYLEHEAQMGVGRSGVCEFLVGSIAKDDLDAALKSAMTTLGGKLARNRLRLAQRVTRVQM